MDEILSTQIMTYILRRHEEDDLLIEVLHAVELRALCHRVVHVLKVLPVVVQQTTLGAALFVAGFAFGSLRNQDENC